MNNTATHTPGPWAAVRENDYVVIQPIDIGVGLWDDPEHRANALLIAKAPEMRTWIVNMATDAQLDTPMPALGGKTGRALLAEIDGTEGGDGD